MKCRQCQTDFDRTHHRQFYCGACRADRILSMPSKLAAHVVPEFARTLNVAEGTSYTPNSDGSATIGGSSPDYDPNPFPETRDLRRWSRQDLVRKIRLMAPDEWIKSKEHRQLMCRFRMWSPARLRVEGYYVSVEEFYAIDT